MEQQLKYGNVLLMEGKIDEARAVGQLLLAKTAGARAQILVGNGYAGIVGVNASLAEAKWIFDREPRLLPPYLNLSAAQNFKPQPALAEKSYKEALSFAPSVETHL